MVVKDDKLTPLMRQYRAVKEKHLDKIVLFRMGDFYETFDEDAKLTAKTLGITLTKRSSGASGATPLAGFPHHALDTYLHKLLKAGHKVAICEQLEDPKLAKGIVKRDITEIVTPGIAVNDKFLQSNENNYIGAFVRNADTAVFCYADISTGEFCLVHGNFDDIRDYFNSIPLREVLIHEDKKAEFTIHFPQFVQLKTSIESWVFDPIYCRDQITHHFKLHSLKGVGLENDDTAQQAVGILLHYIRENFQQRLGHINTIQTIHLGDFLGMDQFTIRNLEILQRLNGERGEGTLISVLDDTRTPMGARLLRNWLIHPLQNLGEINQRLDYVGMFVNDTGLRKNTRSILNEVSDLERLMAKLSARKINPREIMSLKLSLEQILKLNKLLAPAAQICFNDVHTVQLVIELISRALLDEVPVSASDIGIFRDEYHPELGPLREIAFHGKDYLLRLQEKERQRLGIPSLKISYNRVFGYYIEVTNTHSVKIPDDYIRKQTLVNSERYITPELKEYEEKILHAEEELTALESRLYQEFIDQLQTYILLVQKNARIVAETDIYAALAEISVRWQWVKPDLEETTTYEIKNGRHPVIEALLPPGASFVPNDLFMDTASDQILIITGPNMAGKSTYLRQIGIIALMAHVGSYVPAESARIGIVDKIFTRVGASDNLAYGESTFLTEMIETANILNTASNRSLILLDEIGRGTSTYDGLSIAWAVVEYIHNREHLAARTLFATHYHELTELEKILDRVKNYNVAVREYGDKVIFLRKIIAGGADKSYGIYVAQMAGVPAEVVQRANEILHSLSSSDHTLPDGKKSIKPRIKDEPVFQLNIFEAEEQAWVKEIKDLNIDEMTPLQAMQTLDELKRKIKS